MKKKASILCLAFIFSAIFTNAQLYDSTGYYSQLNNIFAPLDKAQIASGLLRDYSIEFNNWDNFTGTQLHDSNFVSLTEWRYLYTGLYSSQINTSPQMLYLDTVTAFSANTFTITSL